MSYDLSKDSNDNNANTGGDNSNPYGQNPYVPPQGIPNPHGLPSAPDTGTQNAYGNPYNTPHGGGQSQNYNQPPQGNPYAHQQQHGQQGGFSFLGLTWQKNVIPNPETNGMPPHTQKSNVVAYVLWFFLGWIGVHQFYLGNTSRGLFNLILWAATTALSVTGIPFSLVFLAYWIYEAVTLNDQTKEVNAGYLRKSIL